MSNKNKIVEKCIIELANGNSSYLDELYSLTKGDVYAYALSKSLPRSDAEDIMQDTFMQIYKNARLYTPKGKPMSWIITIETNLINRYYQLKKRTVNVDDEVLEATIVDDNDYLSSSINNRIINDILSSLNEDERQIIVLHIVSNMKFKDISKLLNKPLSTVLSKYNRAFKKLKDKRKE